MHSSGNAKHLQGQKCHRCQREVVKGQYEDVADTLFAQFTARLFAIVEVLLEDVTLDAQRVFVAEVAPVKVVQVTWVKCPI